MFVIIQQMRIFSQWVYASDFRLSPKGEIVLQWRSPVQSAENTNVLEQHKFTNDYYREQVYGVNLDPLLNTQKSWLV